MATTSVDTSLNSSWMQLAERVLAGYQPKREEAEAILSCSDDELLDLLSGAFHIRKQTFGKQVQLYYLKNAKSGLCSEDCSYCSQAVDSEAEIEKYSWLNEERLLAGARDAAASQAGTYCIVASGRAPSNREVEHVSRVVEKIKDELGLHICCCLGLLTDEQAARLKQAGVNRINHNLNSSRRYYEEICTTHTYDDRLQTLQTAKKHGLELCSGLIVGMGEEPSDIIDTAVDLRDLGVESIPVNFLHSIEGTKLEKVDELNPRYCLKVLALFRYLHPQTEIRIAGGREVQLRSLQALGLYAANSIFVSDYLTTAGQPASEDYRMIEDLGFEVVISGVES